MFRVKHYTDSVCMIVNGGNDFLHSDGSIYYVAEYFPTKETAQVVLDKFYPKPKHVWEHGDVFTSNGMDHGCTMMYIHPEKKYGERKPSVIYVNTDTYAYGRPEGYLTGAKFLFNIKEKI